MELPFTKSAHHLIVLIISIFIITSCSETEMPSDLPGTYSGNEIVLLRYDKDGQYLGKDDIVQVSLIVGNNGEISGVVGEAVFEGCKVTRNRGWLSRLLNIKTDFIINGRLKGRTYENDTLQNKIISMPFNLKNNEINGRLFLNNNGHNYPIISILKLNKM